MTTIEDIKKGLLKMNKSMSKTIIEDSKLYEKFLQRSSRSNQQTKLTKSIRTEKSLKSFL